MPGHQNTALIKGRERCVCVAAAVEGLSDAGSGWSQRERGGECEETMDRGARQEGG